jgi:hypothetical protein
MYKRLLIVFLSIAVLTYSGENKRDTLNIIAPSYNTFIGKRFTQIKEIDSMLSPGSFSTLYKDEKHAVSIYGQRRILNKRHKARFKYVFFTKTVGQQGSSPIEEILDIVTVDMNNYNDSASIRLDECDCKDKKECQTVAIYYRSDTMAKKGIKVKPLKVWQPNIATGKFEELSPDNVRCGEQEQEEK